MSAESTEPEPTDTPAPDEAQRPAGERETGNAEAARYRRQLREAEATRDTLAGRVEAMQRAEVERLAADRLAVPGDLWRFGVDLSALLTDDGDLDAAAVDAAVDALAADRPHLAPRRPFAPDSFGQGRRGTAQPDRGWAELLRGQ